VPPVNDSKSPEDGDRPGYRLHSFFEGSTMPQDSLLAELMAEVRDLRARVDALESRLDEDAGRLALDIAYDRQRLTRLEKVEPQPMQKDRGEILRALIAANGGKMLATDARKKMHLSRSRFSRLLSTAKDDIEAKPYHLNKSWQVLVLR
jgi:hypothetical protein